MFLRVFLTSPLPPPLFVEQTQTEVARGIGGDDDDDGDGDIASEPPFLVTVASFCTLGVAEEGATGAVAAAAAVEGGTSGNTVVGDGDDGSSAPVVPMGGAGGGGAVTPALLPSLFPKAAGKPGFVLSEGVRMVVCSAEQEGAGGPSGGSNSGAGGGVGGAATQPPQGEVSTGRFSLHSATSRDVIVKVRKKRGWK